MEADAELERRCRQLTQQQRQAEFDALERLRAEGKIDETLYRRTHEALGKWR